MATLTASGPKPSGSKEQHAAPGLTCGPNFSLLSKKCIHSACLGPKSLVITGFKWVPPRRNMRAAHLSEAWPSPSSPSGFQSFTPGVSQAWPLLRAAGVIRLRWHLLGPFHTLVLLHFASAKAVLCLLSCYLGSVLELGFLFSGSSWLCPVDKQLHLSFLCLAGSLTGGPWQSKHFPSSEL